MAQAILRGAEQAREQARRVVARAALLFLVVGAVMLAGAAASERTSAAFLPNLISGAAVAGGGLGLLAANSRIAALAILAVGVRAIVNVMINAEALFSGGRTVGAVLAGILLVVWIVLALVAWRAFQAAGVIRQIAEEQGTWTGFG